MILKTTWKAGSIKGIFPRTVTRCDLTQHHFFNWQKFSRLEQYAPPPTASSLTPQRSDPRYCFLIGQKKPNYETNHNTMRSCTN